tara:strand:- start:21 stop:242 length:222 start_codon:yes stop_codon:yes gene_type:complete
MLFQLKKLSFILIFNLALFFILFIGIQNSSSQKKVDLIIVETVNLPVSFIIGLSFISGSIAGSLLMINKWNKK